MVKIINTILVYFLHSNITVILQQCTAYFSIAILYFNTAEIITKISQ